MLIYRDLTGSHNTIETQENAIGCAATSADELAFV
jgi:hypothetical protein